MVKKIVKKILSNKKIAKKLEKIALNIHTYSYNLSGILAVYANNGVHPKHNILKYEEWFLNNIEENWVVLDIGCNIGMMAELLSHKAKFVYGVDIEQKHIKKADKNIDRENTKFICADATKLNYKDFSPIDCVTLSNVLEHIDKRIGFLKALIANIPWRDKQRFLIRVPMIDREWTAVYKKSLGLEYRLDKTHFIEYTFDQFKSELKQANIKIKSYHIRFGEIYAICEGV